MDNQETFPEADTTHVLEELPYQIKDAEIVARLLVVHYAPTW